MQPLDEGAEAARGSVSTLELPCMRMHAYARSAHVELARTRLLGRALQRAARGLGTLRTRARFGATHHHPMHRQTVCTGVSTPGLLRSGSCGAAAW